MDIWETSIVGGISILVTRSVRSILCEIRRKAREYVLDFSLRQRKTWVFPLQISCRILVVSQAEG